MAFDGVATYYGLRFGFISEANPVMAACFNAYPLLTLIVKLGLSLIFLEVLYYAIYEKKIQWPGFSISAFLTIHFIVASMHLYWIGRVIG